MLVRNLQGICVDLVDSVFSRVAFRALRCVEGGFYMVQKHVQRMCSKHGSKGGFASVLGQRKNTRRHRQFQ